MNKPRRRPAREPRPIPTCPHCGHLYGEIGFPHDKVACELAQLRRDISSRPQMICIPAHINTDNFSSEELAQRIIEAFTRPLDDQVAAETEIDPDQTEEDVPDVRCPPSGSSTLGAAVSIETTPMKDHYHE